MKLKLGNKASRMLHKAGLTIKKHSPEILMVAGIAGTIGSTVLACKATGKVNEIVEDAKLTASVIREGIETGQINGKECTKEEAQQALTVFYARTGMEILRVYAPAIVLGTLSITSIVAGHKILKKRNLALMAAYAVVDKGFKEYRKNVVERFGEEVDNELKFGVKTKMIETETIDENGNKVIKQELVKEVDDVSKYSDFTRCFDASCRNHTKDSEANLMYLRRQQDWANERLKSRGFLFLNEVYEALDIPRSQAGQVVGWIYDTKNEKHKGDNYVDFGIYKPGNERFVNGLEYNIWLDFNVDGVIFDKFWDKTDGH